VIEWPILSIGTLVSISARSRTVCGLATGVFDITSSPRASFIGTSQQSDAEGIERCTRAPGVVRRSGIRMSAADSAW
jgi:hypothetical protein